MQDVKTQPNPYLAISKRNAFDLTDAPPPAKDTPTPELPKNLDLKFTGIYRLKGVEKACLALVDSSTKPPETKYLQIPVGDKQGAIEITAIDAEAAAMAAAAAAAAAEAAAVVATAAAVAATAAATAATAWPPPQRPLAYI